MWWSLFVTLLTSLTYGYKYLRQTSCHVAIHTKKEWIGCSIRFQKTFPVTNPSDFIKTTSYLDVHWGWWYFNKINENSLHWKKPKLGKENIYIYNMTSNSSRGSLKWLEVPNTFVSYGISWPKEAQYEENSFCTSLSMFSFKYDEN